MAAAGVILIGLVLPEVLRRTRQELAFIRLSEAINQIPSGIKRKLTYGGNDFDRCVKVALGALNVDDGKRRSDLFGLCHVEGPSSMPLECKFLGSNLSFGIAAKSYHQFSVLRRSGGGFVVSIHEGQIAQLRNNISLEEQVAVILSAVGSSLAYLKAIKPREAEIPRSMFEIGSLSDYVCPEDTQVAAKVYAPSMVALLVGWQMAGSRMSADLHEWHRFALDSGNPFILPEACSEFLRTCRDSFFGARNGHRFEELLPATLEAAVTLIRELGFDGRNAVGRLATF